MARTLPQLGEAAAEQLQVASKQKHLPAWALKRLWVLRLVAQHQHSAQQIAELVGVSRSTVFHYLEKFLNEGGVEGLLKRNYHGGKRPTVTPAMQQELKDRLARGEFIRAKEVQGWVKQRTGRLLDLDTIYYWLGKVGGVLKVPRKTHVKKKAAEVEEFRRELASRLIKVVGKTKRKVRLWVLDEHRYGLLPVIRRCWGLRGVRVHAPYRTRYEWEHLYEAIEVDGENKLELLFAPRVGKDVSNIFLRQIAQNDPRALHVVIWDQAGFHPKDGEEGVPENVRLLPLPAYSPELNPVEKLGDMVKDGIANKIFESLDQLQEAILKELEPLRHNAQRIQQLLGSYSIVASANTCAKC